MKVKGIEGMTIADVQAEVGQGGKFVIFQYCISIIILTFKRSSDVYFIRAGQSTVGAGIGYTLLSLLLGWWGIPWGPIYTVAALANNFKGGKDVTNEIMATFSRSV